MQKLVSGKVSLSFYDVDPLLEENRDRFLKIKQGRTMMIWARFFIEMALPDFDGNVLYADTDTYFAGDLEELFSINLGDNLIGMVPECSRDHRPERFARDGFNADMQVYCNAGVALINLGAWRKEGVYASLIDWIDQRGKCTYVWADQDVLNAVLWRRIHYLPPKYNYHDGWVEKSCRKSMRASLWNGNRPKDVLEAILNPVLLHYWGRKPWKFCHRPEHARYEQVMRELSLIEESLPGTTFFGRCTLPFWDALHAVMKWWARQRLNNR